MYSKSFKGWFVEETDVTKHLTAIAKNGSDGIVIGNKEVSLNPNVYLKVLPLIAVSLESTFIVNVSSKFFTIVVNAAGAVVEVKLAIIVLGQIGSFGTQAGIVNWVTSVT